MLFSSLEFIFRFLPLFLICYYVMPAGGRNAVLFLGSLIFYAMGEPFYIFLMLSELFINYGAARVLHRTQTNGWRRFWLIMAVVCDLGLLFVFKYFDFFAENLNFVLHRDLLPVLELTLPLGISFYTFQMISYVADVYNGTVKETGTFLEFATYVCMFPQLIAGPIVQYKEVAASGRCVCRHSSMGWNCSVWDSAQKYCWRTEFLFFGIRCGESASRRFLRRSHGWVRRHFLSRFILISGVIP